VLPLSCSPLGCLALSQLSGQAPFPLGDLSQPIPLDRIDFFPFIYFVPYVQFHSRFVAFLLPLFYTVFIKYLKAETITFHAYGLI
jgi:hypothetical protein